MPKICSVTGKQSRQGRSYATRGIAKKKKGIGLKTTGITSRRFKANIKKKRLWSPEEKKFITLPLSAAALRTIDKRGVDVVLKDIRTKEKLKRA